MAQISYKNANRLLLLNQAIGDEPTSFYKAEAGYSAYINDLMLTVSLPSLDPIILPATDGTMTDREVGALYYQETLNQPSIGIKIWLKIGLADPVALADFLVWNRPPNYQIDCLVKLTATTQLLLEDQSELLVSYYDTGFGLLQPGDALVFFLAGNEQIGYSEEDLAQPGDLKWSARPLADDGWMQCDGRALSRMDYAALFAAIGITYGPGDNETTFNIPDFRGRTLVGAGTGSGLTTRLRGQMNGAEQVALTEIQMPPHSHAPATGSPRYVDASQFTADAANTPMVATSGNRHPYLSNASKGGGQPHENMPPFGVANIFIKVA